MGAGHIVFTAEPRNEALFDWIRSSNAPYKVGLPDDQSLSVCNTQHQVRYSCVAPAWPQENPMQSIHQASNNQVCHSFSRRHVRSGGDIRGATKRPSSVSLGSLSSFLKQLALLAVSWYYPASPGGAPKEAKSRCSLSENLSFQWYHLDKTVSDKIFVLQATHTTCGIDLFRFL